MDKEVLIFYASWEPAGVQMVDMINEVEKSGRFVKIKKWTKIDAENCESSLLEKYKVSAVPTLVFLFGKDSIWRTLEGADSALAFQTISEFDQAEAAVPEDEEKYDTLETKLQQLIRIAPVMVFMKGSPSEPRCKFSRALMEILQGIEFASFDILRDDEVRQGLKVYWPTYPQIYIQGKLLGGLDNIKELVSSASSSETKEKIKSLKDIILELRLKNLIQKAPVMLFMKGEPTAPRCGFSRTICEILSNADIQFDSFDILEDNDIRQGLKSFSQWPTYPQLYVKGSLVGGLDIVQEMARDGNLKDQLFNCIE
uniref:Glutaredoxin domain-containing protein n=1 Tax=Aureoumbra lagunensis TaxID=44058 RepID=A0A7S3NK94_9STRA